MRTVELPYQAMHASPSQSKDEDDADLLRNYRSTGNAEAMETLFQRHAAISYHMALRALGNSADAEDAVQAAFCQVLEHVEQFQGKSNVRGWIMSIVVNTCRLKIRDEAYRQKHERMAMQRCTNEVPKPEHAEIVSAALRILQSLPEHYRLPIFLRFIGGYSFSDVATALSIPEDTARKQVGRGLEQIRQALTASGFAVSAAAISDLLATSTLPPVPAALTASFKTIIASANGAGAAATATKGAVAATSTKITIAAGLLLAAVTAVLYFGSWNIEPRQDDGAPPAVTVLTPIAAPQIDKSLAEILDKKIDVFYHRDYLSEVLDDLEQQAGLRSAFPKPIDKTFKFTLEGDQIVVKQILEKLAAEGQLDLEFCGVEAVFWKKADDNVLTELGKKLKDGNVKARCEAVHELAQLGDKRIYPPLFHALRDRDDSVAAKAIFELSDQQAQTLRYGTDVSVIVDPLVAMLSSPRTAALKVDLSRLLVVTRVPKAVEPLIKLSKDPDRFVRWGVPDMLRGTQDPRAVETLIALLKDADAGVRAAAAIALGHSRDPKAVETLMALLRDPALRVCAQNGLRDLWNPSLIDLLKDADAEVRASAAYALRHSRDPKAVESRIALLKDPDANVRASVADAYLYPNHSRGPRESENLIALLTNADVKVQSRAGFAFANSRHPKAVEPLIALLKCADTNVRLDVISALGYTRDPKAVEPLVALLKDANVNMRIHVAEALGNTRDPKAVEPLIALLKDANPQVRYFAVIALGDTRDPQAVEPLIALLKDADANVRDFAAIALDSRDLKAKAALEEYNKGNPPHKNSVPPQPEDF